MSSVIDPYKKDMEKIRAQLTIRKELSSHDIHVYVVAIELYKWIEVNMTQAWMDVCRESALKRVWIGSKSGE